MMVEEHEVVLLQRASRALSTVDEVGVVLVFAPGPNCEVALMRGAVQLERLESWLKDVRNEEQFELIPAGMRED